MHGHKDFNTNKANLVQQINSKCRILAHMYNAEFYPTCTIQEYLSNVAIESNSNLRLVLTDGDMFDKLIIS